MEVILSQRYEEQDTFSQNNFSIHVNIGKTSVKLLREYSTECNPRTCFLFFAKHIPFISKLIFSRCWFPDCL